VGQRRLQNKKKVNAAEIKHAPAAYSKEIRDLKRKSFVGFSEEIVDTPVALRLRKVLSKEHSNGLGTLINADGSRTGDWRETLETLMLTHFPESCIVRDTNESSKDIIKTMDGSRDEAWRRSKDLFKGKKVKWAVNKFKLYKSPGLLQNESKHCFYR
jgi:ribosomal protein L30/L7E